MRRQWSGLFQPHAAWRPLHRLGGVRGAQSPQHPRAIRLLLEHKAAGVPTAVESPDFASRRALDAPLRVP